MKSKKTYNPDGTTRKIIVQHDSGSYSSYTPKQAAEMINELRAQLWNGQTLTDDFKQERWK